jgi:hypothetical protein
MSRFGVYFNDSKRLAEESKSIVVTKVDQVDIMLQAREKRLELKNIRVAVEKTRKELKEQSLREGRAIDGVANIIKALIVPVEEHLEKQEKYAEEIEKARIEEKHRVRVERLAQYVEDTSFYNIRDMSDDAFEKLLNSSREAVEAKRAAEIKAEEERIAKEKAEAEERERLRIENEKLKKEQEEQDKKRAAERQIEEEKLEKERKEREKLLEEQRKKDRENEEKLEEERKKRQEIEEKIQREKEEKARQEAENKKKEEEAKRKELLAPDKEKLLNLANSIDTIILPNVQSREAGIVVNRASEELSKVSNYLRERSKSL